MSYRKIQNHLLETERKTRVKLRIEANKNNSCMADILVFRTELRLISELQNEFNEMEISDLKTNSRRDKSGRYISEPSNPL